MQSIMFSLENYLEFSKKKFFKHLRFSKISTQTESGPGPQAPSVWPATVGGTQINWNNFESLTKFYDQSWIDNIWTWNAIEQK